MARHSYSVTWTEICAFWGMVIAAFSHFFGGLFRVLVNWAFEKGAAHDILITVVNVLSLAGNIALLIAIALPAYQFVRFKPQGWKVFYWIMFTLFLISVAFGYVFEAHLR